MRARQALLAAAVFLASDLGLGALLGRDARLLGHPIPPVARDLARSHRAALVAWARAGRPRSPVLGQGLRFDPVLGWAPREGARAGAGGPLLFDADGARARGPRAPAGPFDLTLAAFGDSFTYGAEVAADATWEAALERARPGTRVRNFGVPGYGTDQALLRFRAVGRAGAEVVVLGLFAENVKRNVNRYRPLLYPGTSPSMLVKPRFVLNEGRLELLPLPYATRPELYRALASGAARERLRAGDFWSEPDWPEVFWRSGLARLSLGALRAVSRSTRRLWLDADGEPYRVTRALVVSFASEARAAGAERVGVLLFPTEAMTEELGPSPCRLMLAELQRAGIEVLDLTPPLRRERARGGPPPYARGHLSRRGHEVVASAVAEWLDASGGEGTQRSSGGSSR